MTNKKIYIRVDGSYQIGLGHVVRCIALAQILKENFEIFFVCRELIETSKSEIIKLGFSLITINSEKDFLSLLTQDIIVVLDHYDLDSIYQKNIKNKGCKLVCIDDLHNKTFYADLIINHAPNIEPSDYKAQTYTQFALGFDYVLLRPAFLRKAKERVNNKTVQTVFVCFGGADSKNITQAVVNILKNDDRFTKVIVVTGAAYNYLNQLKRSIAADAKFSLYHSIDAETMAGLIAEAGLAIVPASGILQEVLAMGCKIISGMYVDNQKYIFENYYALGAFESAGDFSYQKLVAAINASFKSIDAASGFIDGKSDIRLLNSFNQLAKEDAILLRNINENDLNKTFEWAGDKEIRKFSFNNNPIEYDVHKRWFINKLNDKNCFYYLGQIDNKAFGSIRFDIGDSEAKISYLVDPAYQNQGLGTILLKKGLDLFLKQLNTNILAVWGEVLNENIASVKVFKKLGYSVEFNILTNFIKFKKIIQSKF
jgi:UDP-2,4-diacetamido-2,4,6-trideoxy-beta-L-altropyranose hydrolase